MTDKYF